MIMLPVYDDYYVLTGISTTLALFPIKHLSYVFHLGLYLHIHLYIESILICRLLDLSNCGPVAIDDNKDPVDLHLHLYSLLILICRLVDLSTCRPTAVDNRGSISLANSDF